MIPRCIYNGLTDDGGIISLMRRPCSTPLLLEAEASP
jgi:hypothetical protein